MAATLPHHLFWAFTTVQLLGLLSAAMARFTENRTGQSSFQTIFLAALSLVAVSTVASLAVGSTLWVISAFTLAVMVVLAIWDPGLRTAT